MLYYGREFIINMSGHSRARFAREAGISHTYLKQLRMGIRNNPSEEVFEGMAKASGLPIEIVKWLFSDETINKEKMAAIIVRGMQSELESD